MRTRFVDFTADSPGMNLAVEEAMFRGLREPLLRVWDNQRSVVVGRAQLASAETDLPLCERRNVPVLRRFTAGGAVYNGAGNTNWSFMVGRDSGAGRLRYMSGPGAVFKEFSAFVVQALGSSGVRARFSPPNSIVDESGMKISGMAAYISSRSVVCHGTLLREADILELKELTTPRGTTPKKYPRSRDVGVANCRLPRKTFVSALASCVGDTVESGPRREEVSLAESLLQLRYSRPEWNLGDPFSLDYSELFSGLPESVDGDP